MDEECFGGQGNSLLRDEANAYMLIYERQLKSPIRQLLTPEEVATLKPEDILESTAEEVVGRVYFDAAAKEYYRCTDFCDVDPVVPRALAEDIEKENNVLAFEEYVYSSDFFLFANSLLSQSLALLEKRKGSEQLENETAQVAAKVFFSIITRAQHNESMRFLEANLLKFIAQSKVGLGSILHFVKKNFEGPILEVLRKCPSQEVKEVLGNALKSAVLLALGDDSEESVRSSGFYVCDALINTVKDKSIKRWDSFKECFEILLAIFIEGSDELKKSFNAKDLTKLSINIYLKSSAFLLTDKAQNSASTIPLLDTLANFICTTISYSDLSFIQPESRYHSIYSTHSPVYELSEDSKRLVTSIRFVGRAIVNATNEVAKLIVFMCYESWKCSKMVMKEILKGMTPDDKQELDRCFLVVRELLSLKDSLQQQRIEWLLGIPTMITQGTVVGQSVGELRLGLGRISGIAENVVKYYTPFGRMHRALLSFYWINVDAISEKQLCLLLDLMLKVPEVFIYVVNLPPPTYQYARYIDWIGSFERKPRSVVDSTTKKVYKVERKDKVNQQKLMQLYSQVEEQMALSMSMGNSGINDPTSYIVGRVQSETQLRQETKGGITLSVSEVVTECLDNCPSGENNSAVPPGYFADSKSPPARSAAAVLKLSAKNGRVAVTNRK